MALFIKRTDIMKNFKAKIKQLNNPTLEQELLELYLIDQDKAYSQFRIEFARKFMAENKSLFEKLSKL